MQFRTVGLIATATALLALSGCVAGFERREDRRDDRQDRRQERHDYSGVQLPALDQAGPKPAARST